MLFTLETNLSYISFLTTSFFTTSLSLLKSTGTGTNLSMSNLSTSVFRLFKFVFNEKLEVSTCEMFLMSDFVAWFESSSLAIIFLPNGLYGFGKTWLFFI